MYPARENHHRSVSNQIMIESRTPSPNYDFRHFGTKHQPSHDFLHFLSRKADQWKSGPLNPWKTTDTGQRQMKNEPENALEEDHSSQVLIRDKNCESGELKLTKDSKRDSQTLREDLENLEQGQSARLQVQQLFSYNFEPLRKRSTSDCKEIYYPDDAAVPEIFKIIIPKRQNSAPSISTMLVKTKNGQIKLKSGSFAPGMNPLLGSTPDVQYKAAKTERGVKGSRAAAAGCILHQSVTKKNKSNKVIPYQQEIKETAKVQNILTAQSTLDNRFKPERIPEIDKRYPVQAFSTSILKKSGLSRIVINKTQGDSVQIHKILEKCVKSHRGRIDKLRISSVTDLDSKRMPVKKSVSGSKPSLASLKKLQQYQLQHPLFSRKSRNLQ